MIRADTSGLPNAFILALAPGRATATEEAITPIHHHAVTPIRPSTALPAHRSCFRGICFAPPSALSALHHRQFHEAVAGVENLDGGFLVISGFGQQNITDVGLRVAIIEREPA